MVRESAAGVIIDIRVIPRAGKTAIAGTRDNAVLVRVAAPPVDGAANAAVRRFFADVLDIPARAVTIAAGEHSRSKRLMIAGLDADTVRARLGL